MLNIAIVDDEQTFINSLRSQISKCLISKGYDFRITDYVDPIIFLSSIENKIYHQIVFLDIDMPKITGIELSKKMLKYGHHSIIIFVTSKESFIYDAYGLNVFGLILKKDVARLVDKKLMQCLRYIERYKKIDFKTPVGDLYMIMADIIYIEMVNRKIYIYTVHGKFQVYVKALKDLFECLDNYFFMINRNCIVNLQYVNFGIDYLILNNKEKTKLYISNRKIKEFKEAYLNFNLGV